jgi:hypothetical protein
MVTKADLLALDVAYFGLPGEAVVRASGSSDTSLDTAYFGVPIVSVGVVGALSASLNCQSTATFPLTTNITLAASLVVQSTLAAGWIFANLVTGSEITAGITTDIRLLSALSATATEAAALTTNIKLAAALVGTSSASLTENHIASVVASQATVTASLTTNIKMALALVDVAVVSALLQTNIRLASSSIQAFSSLSALLNIGFTNAAAALTCSSSITAAIVGNNPMQGDLRAQVGISASLSGTAATLGAALHVQSSISIPRGNNGFNTKITGKAQLTGTNGVICTVTGTLIIGAGFYAPIAAQSIAQGTLTTNVRMASVLSTDAELSPRIHTDIVMVASLSTSTLVPDMDIVTSVTMASELLVANSTLSEIKLYFRILVWKYNKIAQVPIGEEGLLPPVRLLNGRLVQGNTGKKLFYRLGRFYEATDEDLVE